VGYYPTGRASLVLLRHPVLRVATGVQSSEPDPGDRSVAAFGHRHGEARRPRLADPLRRGGRPHLPPGVVAMFRRGNTPPAPNRPGTPLARNTNPVATACDTESGDR